MVPWGNDASVLNLKIKNSGNHRLTDGKGYILIWFYAGEHLGYKSAV